MMSFIYHSWSLFNKLTFPTPSFNLEISELGGSGRGGVPGGSVVKNPLPVQEMGSILGPGRFHMLQSI